MSKDCEFCGTLFFPKKEKVRFCSKTCSNNSRHEPIEWRLIHRGLWVGDCYIWQGALDSCGYGSIMYNSKLWKVTRLTYTLFKGDIPEGHVIMHKCDTPACFRLEHLSTGTVAENIQDMARKDRHGKISLSTTEVNSIIERVKNGEKQNVLAKEFKVACSTINRYVHGVRRNV